ncbi:MAG: hypothetical protein Q4G68_03665 [Planctomycetia bacterium]|nr:hypothetical protein [Planctomycetia bacterium]
MRPLFALLVLLLTSPCIVASETLSQTRELMTQYAQQLAAGQSGDSVRQQGDTIVSLLESLIQESKEQQQREQEEQNGEESEASDSAQEQSESGESQDESESGKKTKNSQSQPVTVQEETAVLSPGTGKPRQAPQQGGSAGEVLTKRQTQGEWGGLPSEKRESVMQKIDQRFPQQYRNILENYFRNIAR